MGEALRILRDHGDRGGVAEALTELGALHLACDDLDAARRSYQQALDLAREIGSPADEGTALAGLGRCARDPVRAARLLTEAHQVLFAIGSAVADAVARELGELRTRRAAVS
jgi:tetratricopeptide (TPR) repeat protein